MPKSLEDVSSPLYYASLAGLVEPAGLLLETGPTSTPRAASSATRSRRRQQEDMRRFYDACRSAFNAVGNNDDICVIGKEKAQTLMKIASAMGEGGGVFRRQRMSDLCAKIILPRIFLGAYSERGSACWVNSFVS
jgi:hypothetical protein